MRPKIHDVVVVGRCNLFARAIVEDVYFAGAKVRLIEDLDGFVSGTRLIVSLENIMGLHKFSEST